MFDARKIKWINQKETSFHRYITARTKQQKKAFGGRHIGTSRAHMPNYLLIAFASYTHTQALKIDACRRRTFTEKRKIPIPTRAIERNDFTQPIESFNKLRFLMFIAPVVGRCCRFFLLFLFAIDPHYENLFMDIANQCDFTLRFFFPLLDISETNALHNCLFLFAN